MIRKYLIFGKQVFLSSAPREVHADEEVQPNIELRMPIEVFWQCEEIIKNTEYMQSTNEDLNRVKDSYKLLLKVVTPYAVLEKDRIWLLEQNDS